MDSRGIKTLQKAHFDTTAASPNRLACNLELIRFEGRGTTSELCVEISW
jgi:hypothetical protein